MSKNLVFTSAGDNTNFINFWVSDKQNYDICVYYYGNRNDNFNKYKERVKYIEKSKGVKFHNFHKFYTQHPEIINQYERFFILDDDIEMSSDDINEMFRISEYFNLEVCGPSFTPHSKISWQHTAHKENILLTYTNFVEVNVPLMSINAVRKLMDVYNPDLLEWGVDFLYIWANGSNKRESYAIIHKIQCTNPRDNRKVNGSNEMKLTSSERKREDMWNKICTIIGCPNRFNVEQYLDLPIYYRLEKDINLLVVVLSCQKHKSLWPEILSRNITNIVILCGGSDETYLEDNILHMKCNDLYDGLPEKMICAIDFILKEPKFSTITNILKVDDHDTKFTTDTISSLNNNRILNCHDYIGQKIWHEANFRHHIGRIPNNPFWNNRPFQGPVESFISGDSTYILSRYAMECINDTYNVRNLTFVRYMYVLEDVMIGIILKAHGIRPHEMNYGIKYTPDIQTSVEIQNAPKEESTVAGHKGWVHIGNEHETLRVPPGSKVRFGKDYSWFEKIIFEESFQANRKFFGCDPAVRKRKEVHLYVE